MAETDFQVECEILTKKIQSKFYTNSLWLYSADHNWWGEITSIGDVVIQEHSNLPIYIEEYIDIYRKRIVGALKDVNIINNLSDNMSSELRIKVESSICSELKNQQMMDDYRYKYKINFASNIIIAGGFMSGDESVYNFRLIYGFNLETI